MWSPFVGSRQSLKVGALCEPFVTDLAVRFEVAEQGVSFVHTIILHCLLSEIALVDVDLVEHEQTVQLLRPVVSLHRDQSRWWMDWHLLHSIPLVTADRKQLRTYRIFTDHKRYTV